MSFSEVDQRAINTIRVLAVSISFGDMGHGLLGRLDGIEVVV